MRVLITGATGFAGRHLCSHCLSLGHQVHALVRPGREAAVPEGVAAHPAELGEAASVIAVLEAAAPERLFHLAGAASVGRSFAEPLATWQVNLDGTLAVLEALRTGAPEVPALVVTSGEVYGTVPLDALPVGPATPLNPVSPYGASKAAADLATAQYRAAYGLPAFRVRAFNQIGPGQDARFVLPSVARQIARAERDGLAEVEVRVGNVDTRRDFTDVRDMVRAYWLILERGDPDALYLACRGSSIRVSELIEGLALIARVSVSFTSDAGLRREGEQPDLYGSPERLREDTGWTPEIPIDTTLADTLAWWRERVSEEED